MSAPANIPSKVPTGPANGKNVVPGITNAPQPTAQPNDIAHAPNGDRYRRLRPPLYSSSSCSSMAWRYCIKSASHCLVVGWSNGQIV